MIIHKELKNFLELIYNENINFKDLEYKVLYKHFKNNEFYKLKDFCVENELVNIKFKQVSLTSKGIDFFNFLKKLRKI